jgi:hypothetical protein
MRVSVSTYTNTTGAEGKDKYTAVDYVLPDYSLIERNFEAKPQGTVTGLLNALHANLDGNDAQYSMSAGKKITIVLGGVTDDLHCYQPLLDQTATLRITMFTEHKVGPSEKEMGLLRSIINFATKEPSPNSTRSKTRRTRSPRLPMTSFGTMTGPHCTYIMRTAVRIS